MRLSHLVQAHLYLVLALAQQPPRGGLCRGARGLLRGGSLLATLLPQAHLDDVHLLGELGSVAALASQGGVDRLSVIGDGIGLAVGVDASVLDTMAGHLLLLHVMLPLQHRLPPPHAHVAGHLRGRVLLLLRAGAGLPAPHHRAEHVRARAVVTVVVLIVPCGDVVTAGHAGVALDHLLPFSLLLRLHLVERLGKVAPHPAPGLARLEVRLGLAQGRHAARQHEGIHLVLGTVGVAVGNHRRGQLRVRVLGQRELEL